MNSFCPWEGAQYLIYSSNVPSILYYALIPGMIVSLLLSLFILTKDRKSFNSKLLFFICSMFFAWGFFALILFATNNPDIVMFYWSLTILVEPLIYIGSFYLAYVFLSRSDLSFNYKTLLFVIILPFIVFLSTKYNLSGVNLNDCTATEGFIALYYSYIVEIVFSLLILILSIVFYRQTGDASRKKEIKYFTVGLVLFLLTFSSGNIIGSFADDWVLSQLGYFGMPIFVGFLGYLIVKYKSFNIKLIATQALVWGLAILIGSQFFFIKVPINMVLNGVTFVASIIFGYFLIKSVKKEIQQKEELAQLNVYLENLLKQRESLVHLITHKVKGSFTHSKYIFAGMLDGSFGAISPELQKMAEKGLESDNLGIETVDLVLNAANLQKGTVKYDMKIMDFKEIVLKTIAEKKGPAEIKGLKIEMEIKDGIYNIMGDSFWLKEVVNNLIGNSIIYTEKGKITIGLEGGNGKIEFYVKDTGVGITPEDKKSLFTEGGRGKESVKMNIDSTGYGLYSGKLIIEAHKGRVWAESEGAGKGSIFFVELPAA